MNIFPYSNFHDLNLDWLLQQVKQLRTDVDGLIGSATPSNDTPEMDGAGAAGTSVTYARGDHQHPTDTSRASATDLADEVTARTNKDLSLDGDIAAVDAKIHFSESNPMMDGSPSAGFSTDQARADHIHPTDTSRASASDLTTEIYNRQVADLGLDNRIGALETAIQFSPSNPLMDGTANPGSSTMQSRADHVHPTDTSRASATDLAVLEARVDGIMGATNPYTSTPEMDGVADAGRVNEYARGDHVHPTDTTRLSNSGGTMSGNYTLTGRIHPRKLNNYYTTGITGWLRILKINVKSIAFRIGINVKQDSNHIGEYHEVLIHAVTDTYVTITNEISSTAGLSQDIAQIRVVKNSGSYYVDIFSNSNTTMDFGICIIPVSAPTENLNDDVELLNSIDPNTSGTSLAAYTFNLAMGPDYKHIYYVDDTTARNITISANNYQALTYDIPGLTSDKVVGIGIVTWSSNSGGVTFFPYGNGTTFYALGAAGTTITGLKLRFFYYD